MKTITHAIGQLLLTIGFTACCFTLGCVIVIMTPIVFIACVLTLVMGGELKVGDGK